MSPANRHRIRLLAVLSALAALSLAAVPATSAASEQIVKECLNNGYVDPDKHSREELQSSLDGLPSDIAEYTDCYDVIADALASKRQRRRSGGGQSDARAAAGVAGGAGGGGDAGADGNPPTVEEHGGARNEIESTLQRSAPKVAVGGEGGAPKLDGLEPAAASNELPLPILLALIAIALMLATGAALTVRSKLRGSLRRRRS